MFLLAPESSEAVERFYKSSADAQGFLMNLTAAWAWRPDVFGSNAAVTYGRAPQAVPSTSAT